MSTANPSLTLHEAQAVLSCAEVSGKPVHCFRVVHRPEPETWYDWFDPETGKYGQCRMGRDGRWLQAPRGVQPVVLAYLG
jgi:hypothetical protein